MIWLKQFCFSSGNCPICHEVIQYEAFVIVSPWIRERIKTKKKISLLGVCKSCYGATFSFRYDYKQMKLIYEFYRDDNYNALRFKWEKWYGIEYQQGQLTKEYIEGRKKEISEFLSIHLPVRICRIVDIGGGNGELIPDALPGNCSAIQKYVLDISNVKTINNVTKINSLDETDRIDLAIYSHTIEHVPNPLVELENILQYTDNVYLETPYGIPKISFVNRSILLNILFTMFSLHPWLWRNMFTLSVGLKSKGRIIKQSEHINFFEVETIEKLANLLNCESYIKLSSVNNPLGEKHQVIQALFSKKQLINNNIF